MQDDLPAFKKGYLKAVKYISLLTFPILAGLAVFAREFIMVLLGEKWIEMTMPLIILTPMAMLKSVGTIKGSVLMAVGRPDIELKWNLVYLAPLVGVVYWGAQYGLTGVATAFTLLYVITFPIIQQITNNQVDVSMFEFAKAMSESAVATLAMAGAGLAVRHFLQVVSNCGDLAVLLAGIFISALVYLLVVGAVDKSVVKEFKSMFTKSQNDEITVVGKG